MNIINYRINNLCEHYWRLWRTQGQHQNCSVTLTLTFISYKIYIKGLPMASKDTLNYGVIWLLAITSMKIISWNQHWRKKKENSRFWAFINCVPLDAWIHSEKFVLKKINFWRKLSFFYLRLKNELIFSYLLLKHTRALIKKQEFTVDSNS